LETTVSNSYQLYKLRFPLTGKSPLEYREELANELVEEYVTNHHFIGDRLEKGLFLVFRRLGFASNEIVAFVQ